MKAFIISYNRKNKNDKKGKLDGSNNLKIMFLFWLNQVIFQQIMVSFLPRTKQYNKRKCLEVKIYSSMISPFEDIIQ